MQSITLEQALFHRPDGHEVRLLARSSGFIPNWLLAAIELAIDFGVRPVGMACPPTIFAQPIDKKHVAVVRVLDDPPEVLANGDVLRGLRFHFLVVERKNYEAWICDPFLLAERVAATWQVNGELPTITLPTDTFRARTFAEVQEVLRRVKASGLREGEDPESPDFERTADNSESPALLGGAQILVDGGRLVFERPAGDVRLVSGLWLLLPEMTRYRLWPTSFAFSQDIPFDVLVVPRINDDILEGYTTEEQAADYPDGAYELALQRAVEHGDQRDLDDVLRRRDGNQTLRLAIALVIAMSLVVLVSRWLTPEPPAPIHAELPVATQRAATASAIVSVGDPYMTLGIVAYWKDREAKKN